MKVLTVQQYWAWAIIAGVKNVENRTWSTSHRGPLAIHAGQQTDPASLRTLKAIGCTIPTDTPSGCVLGIVDLSDVVQFDPTQRRFHGIDDPYNLVEDCLATGPFCWILRNPRPLTSPFLLRGQPGLFEVTLP